MIENDRIERAMLEGYARGVKDGYGDGYGDGWKMAERNMGEWPKHRNFWLACAAWTGFAFGFVIAVLMQAWRIR